MLTILYLNFLFLVHCQPKYSYLTSNQTNNIFNSFYSFCSIFIKN